MRSVPCVRFQQNGCRLFLFTVEAKQIHEFARVPHVGRDADTGKLDGFQRPEVRQHIKAIREYIEAGDRPIIPNAVVLAFDDDPKFTPASSATPDLGTLEIPDDPEGCADIVDGQQRCAAIRDADVESFPVSVVAFVAETEEFKREQFMRVNSSRPLPRQFIMELLPGVNAAITADLEKRRVPAVIIDALNNAPESPLAGLIKTATNTGGEIPGTVFADGIAASLKGGALYNLRGDGEAPADTGAMVSVVSNYWKAVAAVFKRAWESDRKESRITYGGPVGALMALMDEIAGELPPNKLSQAYFKRELAHVAPACHWTAESGDWDFGPDGRRPWNALDNSTKGIGFLSTFLMKTYRRAKAKPEEDDEAA